MWSFPMIPEDVSAIEKREAEKEAETVKKKTQSTGPMDTQVHH
ncbi:hypothetical protein PC116_g19198 [Phytophthora cactorum]|uniref:Uncharacterized protein n=1 Tax=Phytophthora cactorum TaxID=29920 RepID=A0A329RIM4_9STRA|nr:hypothetical protein Pcac1_g3191 [Phytophthora cactorum]KAG2812738.1 hypothetical protein PC112_g15047 [Phytophthora cactorum]KAG2835042.1 hypothetical protein PC111_g5573 [Phytophthora cactorum]KAG2973569.1 hypothetical protein PC118_g15044 [Phytophthora cactorum]KAG3009869.1 hypothetical protein PC120_g15390 [Phytophthora cactorum]